MGVWSGCGQALVCTGPYAQILEEDLGVPFRARGSWWEPVDARDLKSRARIGVRVRLPPRVLRLARAQVIARMTALHVQRPRRLS